MNEHPRIVYALRMPGLNFGAPLARFLSVEDAKTYAMKVHNVAKYAWRDRNGAGLWVGEGPDGETYWIDTFPDDHALLRDLPTAVSPDKALSPD